MSPGDRPSIPLETEPAVWLHPAGLGTVAPGGVQPVERVPALEEEPALWLDPAAARRRRPRQGRPADPARPALPTRSAPALPATGSSGGLAAGLGLVALGWVLRRRQSSEAGGPSDAS